ncbi:D-lactate dehydrogenase [Cnuella takakiae]|uniref:D-lactate dehydrogenase n=1 Tax=Cnuella takakiae TaxID=1302690 RepID=A0A1M5F6G3_9BACT|nr:2-hydroxyacid dehydrogenase [Cnuella takakiae]OLY90980.1 hydroxyacid dehydrogenase [Cnuella takakiae]SHF86681.1 D-lactate dehydrogenase [Cnuella takakiae]
MKITFFSTQPYDKQFFIEHNKHFHYELEFFEMPLNAQTVSLVQDATVICVFVNDKVDAAILAQLKEKGVEIIALRCAGFNNVDLQAADSLAIQVCRVPAYSPEAVAEHAMAMILTLNRKVHKAYNRVREQNFSLQGLMGFDLYGKTVGVIGTGKIGKALCRILLGFGCNVLGFDLFVDRELEAAGVQYLPLIELLQQADIISLHSPLNDQTRHMINSQTLKLMKKGVMIINTSRGALIDTRAVIEALKTCQVGYLGIDVYEQEEKLFFHDHSEDIIEDDIIQRLMGFPNVLVTAHQAFFTREAMDEIAETTLHNIHAILAGEAAELPGKLV